MTKELFIFPKVLDDLEIIFEYGVNAFGESNAINFLQEFQDAFSILCSFDLGTVCDEIRPDLFRYIMGNYAIFFTRTNNAVSVVRVLHSSQDIKRQFS